MFAMPLGLPPVWGAAKYQVLHNFGSGNDGSGPYGPLILSGEGNLYGVTGDGGSGQCSDYGCGTVFELERKNGAWRESVLYNFTAGNDGAIPWGSLTFDNSGDLLGTLQGDNGLGGSGVFRLSPGSGGWSNALIYTDGAGPGLLMDDLGNLYGEMGPGQYKYYGAIADLSSGSNGWNYDALYSFCGQQRCPDGYGPPATPIWDGNDNMFGTTLYGGIGQPACWISYGCGVVYEMIPNGNGTWTYIVLHRFLEFSPSDGQSPEGGLVMDKSGNFYGTTALGGAYDNGIVFKLSHSSGDWGLKVLYDFPDCKLGCGPSGNLVFDKSGNLYGVNGGGLPHCGYDCGVIYKLSPQKSGKWKYSVLHKFTGKDGNFPGFGMAIDGNGNLFGVTTSGGKYNQGVAFEITP